MEEKLDEAQNEFVERKERMQNVIIFGVPESNVTHSKDRKKDEEMVHKICENINAEAVVIEDSFRLGKFDHSKHSRPRPMKVKLKTKAMQQDMLKNAENLATSNDDVLKQCFLKPDMTKKEREERQKVVKELKDREKSGETDLVIFRDRVVKRRPPRQANTETKLQM